MFSLTAAFLSSIVSVRFALMFDIPADIFFRYRSDRFHIIGMVPQLPFPKLVSYFRKTFEKFPAGDPFRYFTIAVMDNFGRADTKQCTWSPSSHSNRWTCKALYLLRSPAPVPADMPRPPHLISSAGILPTIPYGN